jgi:hypothetical protein
MKKSGMKKSRIKPGSAILDGSWKLPLPGCLPILAILVFLQVRAWSQGTTSEHQRIGKELSLNLETLVETGGTLQADPYADEPGFRFVPRALVSVSLWNRLTLNTGLQGTVSQVIREDGSIVSEAVAGKIQAGASWRFVSGPYRLVPAATLGIAPSETHEGKPVLGFDGGLSLSWLRDPVALGASANASLEQDRLALGAGLSLTEAFNENVSATGALESSMDLSRAMEIAYIESGNLYTSASMTLMVASRLGAVHATLSLPLGRPLASPSVDLGIAVRFISLRH